METDEERMFKSNSGRKKTCIIAVVLFVGFAVSITVGLVLYHGKDPPPTPKPPKPPKPARQESNVNCYPQGNYTQQQCENRGCLWMEMLDDGAPNCHFPAGYGYKLIGMPMETSLGFEFLLSKTNHPTLFGGDVQTVLLQVEFHSNTRLRLKFKDNSTERFEVPDEALHIDQPAAAASDDGRIYNVTWTDEPQFGISVFRRETGAVVFNTSLPGMVFSDQFIQLTTKLPSGNVYGFGEHNHRQLHHDMGWKTWSIFARGIAPTDDWNLYGAQTFYMNLEKDGKANGVFLKNSNAMDIVLQPNPYPAITFRVIGGILDFYIFLGPSPENVVQQYTKAVGRPLMPPYWSLGFQLSRWNYLELSTVQEVVRRNRAAGIPFDVQFGDIDYMFKKIDFTYDRRAYDGLPEFIDDIHDHGQKYIVILDHAMGANKTILEETKKNSPGFNAYQDGLDRGIYVKNPNGTGPLFAEVWPGLTVFPDFTNVSSQEWWTQWCRFLYENESIRYDAIWIDMNEPSSFIPGSIDGCENNKWNNPPYIPKILGAGDDRRMYDRTICMDSIQEMGLHYDVHSLYGHTMTMRTYRTLEDMFPKKRPLVLTRSNFAGTQKYGIHWLGDNQSQWRQIPWSIVAMLEYSIFGFSMTGSDICGFWYATDEEMCTRWTQLGAFYPYSRNHNARDFRPQDPANFSDAMIRSSRNILQTRYKFLPFLYTLMHAAHVEGLTVARPLFFEFPMDNKTWTIDKQFMWASALMVSPAMAKGQTEVEIYFPKARWYDYFTGEEVKDVGEKKIIDTPLHKINVHIRGGNVIPWQEPDNTTVYSRQRSMGLLVALDESHKAKGELFWDDGDSADTYTNGSYLKLKFDVKGDTLTSNVVHNQYTEAAMLYFETIDIFGLGQRTSRVNVDGVDVEGHLILDYNGMGKGATRIINQHLNITQPHTISWQLF